MRSESKRQQRFSAVIQQELADIFQKEAMGWVPGAFITVTVVRSTPDLSVARVYLSFLNIKTAEEDLEKLKKYTSEIRYKLGNRIRHVVRIVPELEFFLDDTNVYVEKMDEIFKKIKKDDQEE